MTLSSRWPIVVVLLGIFLSSPGIAAETKLASRESQTQHDERMQWWRDARFGMFIHWGLYAIPAGVWDGKPVDGIGEWIMDRANIPVKEYEKLAAQFNPVDFNAAQWVKIAKQAGMKYIVITSKHHDGFCLFNSSVTKYDVVDAAPYGRSLLKPLSDECRRQGLKFCVYYSIMDWHHPSQTRGSDQRYNPTKINADRKQEYMDFMKSQLKELIANCDPAVLWFDGEWPDWWKESDGRELYAFLLELNPKIIVNNRVGKGRKGMEGLSRDDQAYSGDFGTPEQQIPATGVPGVDWESCMTMNDTWGFKSGDSNWKSANVLLHNLIDIASKGGNYLLNVGPTARGKIPAPSVDRLEDIGKWMQVNGESLYGTQASPFKSTPWGRCTRKALPDGKTRLYLHVFKWPESQKLSVPVLDYAPLSAHLLANGTKLEISTEDSTIVINVPAQAPDSVASVVVLDVQQK